MITSAPGPDQKPLVSVIVAAYNAGPYIGETLASALRQSYTPLEIIVVDDGSTDDTCDVVRALAASDPRLRLIRQENLGVAAARNRAIAVASGEFIAPLDADDLWDPTKIERQVQRIQESGPETGMVYCWWAWIDSEGVVLDRSPRWQIEGSVLDRLVEVNFTGNASVPMYRRSVVDDFGGFAEKLRQENAQGCEDWDLAIRVAEHHAVSVVPAVLVGYRRRADSMSGDGETMWRSRSQVMAALSAREPSLSPSVLQRSSAQFALHLAGVAFWSGNYRQAFRWAFRVRPFLLVLEVAPHVALLLARRLLRLRSPSASLLGTDGRFDPWALPEPLIPYDRICAVRWRDRAREPLMRRLIWILKLPVLPWAHELVLARLRLEGWLASSDKPAPSPRVIVNASWTFPVYSQTFVHHEVLALARSGATVRFLYPRRGRRRDLADTCDDLWKLKRRVLLHAWTGRSDLARFRRRMPERVEALMRLVSTNAGVEEEELLRNEHFLQAFSFARAVEAWRADYLHSYFFYEQSLFALVASQLLGIPRGVSCYADHMLQDYPLKLVRLHLQTCDVIVATSQRIRAELEALTGGPLPQVIVKPNAIDISAFRMKDRRALVEGRPLRLLCVCRIDAKKGIEYLIEAVRVLNERGIRVELDIVGAPDNHRAESREYETALRRRSTEFGLARSIRFVGRRSNREVRGFLEAADIFVAPYVDLPSGDKDGIPTAVLEAMAAGLAIVATDAGSIREIIDDGRQGLIVPQRDAKALADAAQRLRENPELAARLGSSAATRARAEYDVANSEGAFHERVRAVAGASPKRPPLT